MLTNNPRVNVVLEKPLYHQLQAIARKEKVSLSLKARDMIKKAIEVYEDHLLVRLAEKRMKTPSKKFISHTAAWSHLKHK